jgi:uncharacterized protein (DUF111 family)
VLRAGVSATRGARRRVPAGGAAGGEGAPRGSASHPHRHVAGIERLIARSALAPGVRDRAIALVRAWRASRRHPPDGDRGRAPARGRRADSILDIVGGVFALEWFGADRIVALAVEPRQRHRPLRARHFAGAGAGDRADAGRPGLRTGRPSWLTTPTGALPSPASPTRSPLPPMRVEAIGYGAGSRDFADRPNVLRIMVGEAEGRRGSASRHASP